MLSTINQLAVSISLVSIVGQAAASLAGGQPNGKLDAMWKELYRVLSHFETVRTDLKLDYWHVLMRLFLIGWRDLFDHVVHRLLLRLWLPVLVRLLKMHLLIKCVQVAFQAKLYL